MDTRDPSVYHGHDGFGDVPDPDAPDASLIQKENAIQAMLRIANDHQGWDFFDSTQLIAQFFDF